MIRKSNITLMTVNLGLAVMMTACESQVSDTLSPNVNDACLEVKVSGLNPITRSAIMGDTLPNNSHFSLYLTQANSTTLLEDDFNIVTLYRRGEKCELSREVSLNGLGDASVYAFYPSTFFHPYEMPIDAVYQTDYLWGRSEDANGLQSYVNQDQPTANIRFEHVMALITLRIHRSADNTASYSIPSIAFDGDGENTFREAYINVMNREFIWKGYRNYDPIEASLSATVLDESNDLIEANFLVIPSQTRWTLRVNFSGEYQYFWDAMPEEDYQSGKRYIYDCEINKSGMLVISDCTIQPWEKTDMPELETY